MPSVAAIGVAIGNAALTLAKATHKNGVEDEPAASQATDRSGQVRALECAAREAG